MTSTKSFASASAKAPVKGRLTAMIEPNAETGSQARARS